MDFPSAIAIIPAHNESSAIADVVAGLCAWQFVKRILVVDDNSDDGTAASAIGAGAEALQLGKGQGGGKGQAMREGLAFVKGDACDYYLFMDGDGQHDPASLGNFAELLKSVSPPDILLGSRAQCRHLIPKARWLTNVLGTWALSKIAGVAMEDSQCGFRMIRKEIMDSLQLTGDGFTFEMEVALKAAHRHWRWAHVPVKAIYPKEGYSSHFRGAMDTWLIAWHSLRC
jgi:glycosyltransferase involved in cell wall biosynthesis